MNQAKSSRQSFGETLLILGEQHPEVVVLEADLGKSTNSYRFGEKFPDRYFQMGIAEANMIGTAAGLALAGKIPFICSFAVFLTGRYDIIRMSIAYSQANVKIIGTHAGIAIGGDGYSQQALEDIALMRSLPGMSVIQPCDDLETQQAIEYAATHQGPMFFRLTRQNLQPIHSQDYSFQYGKGEILKEGSDITIFSTGGVVHNSLKAAMKLEKQGIGVRVVNIHTLKPLDRDLVLESARQSQGLMTVEDHSTTGGLGSAISELTSEEFPIHIHRLGLRNCFGESGSPEELYQKFHLDTEGIYQESLQFIKELKRNSLRIPQTSFRSFS